MEGAVNNGNPATPQSSGLSLNNAMERLKASESTTSMDSIGTVTSQNGVPAFTDPRMEAKFKLFCEMEAKEQEKAKRKRQKSGQPAKAKKQRPLMSVSHCDSGWKEL